ncbi:hypothetical protein ILUMI_10866 [Ignelater luminosus]|uniref:Tc1-like transposase DDE domain-containing protein n=1 Tax=Ignelater luminosus TaxID=2038154 RepID=A0A8K0D1B3_IGNLU|nr:hypothetical protein ILUMI_10866 [Ignelater luminosus]
MELKVLKGLHLDSESESELLQAAENTAPPTRMQGSLTAVQYISILEDVILPSVRNVYPLVWDNSSINTADTVNDWFQEHSEIRRIRWPARFSDLNPI